MKILSNNIGGIQNKKLDTLKKTENTKDFGKEVAKVKQDSITISSMPENRSTAQLIETLKNQIMNEVRSGTEVHKLEELRQQVATGDYDANPSDIVHRLMNGI